MSCTELRNFTTLKLFRQINKIGSMKSFVKPNCNLCMEERLIILKHLFDKSVTLTNKNSEIYGPAVTKQLSIGFA